MKAGQFEDNTMLPKIQASVAFVEEKPGRRAVITSIGKAKEGYLEKQVLLSPHKKHKKLGLPIR